MGQLDKATVTVLVEVRQPDGTAATFELTNVADQKHGPLLAAIRHLVAHQATPAEPEPATNGFDSKVVRDLHSLFADPKVKPTVNDVFACHPVLRRINCAMRRLRKLGVTDLEMAVALSEPMKAAGYRPYSVGALQSSCKARTGEPAFSYEERVGGWRTTGILSPVRGVLAANVLEELVKQKGSA